MQSSHFILCRPLLILPPIPPSIRVFSNESTLCMRWPKYWSFSFSISPSKEHPGLISFRMDWLDLLAVRGTLKSLLQQEHKGSEVKASACNVGDLGSIPGLGRSPGEGNGKPLQYSCLENPMDRGAWRAYSPQGCKESDTTEQLNFHFNFQNTCGLDTPIKIQRLCENQFKKTCLNYMLSTWSWNQMTTHLRKQIIQH